MTKLTFREVAEDYLQWVTKNRSESFSKRQERILREDLLPTIGELSIDHILSDFAESVKSLPTAGKRGLAAHNTVSTVIGWRVKFRSGGLSQ